MHREALTFLRHVAEAHPEQARGWVLEVGSRIFYDQARTVGRVRDLFPDPLEYLGIDAVPGPGVDICARADEWMAEERRERGPTFPGWDFVVCAEVLEHDPYWPATVEGIAAALRPGGVAALTWATPARAPHCEQDGSPCPGYYAGVPLQEVCDLLRRAGLTVMSAHTERRGEDGQCWGVKA